MAKGKFSTAVWAFLLAAIISFSAIGCLVTGLNIEADLDFLLFTCVTVSLVWTAACQFRWLPVILLAGLETWVLADLLLGSTISSALRDPLEVLVHHISKYYDRGYHWGVIQWSEVLPQASPDLILAVLAGTVALLVSWVICQRRSAFWAVPMAWVPLLLCMVLSDTVPDTGYLMAFLMGIVLLVMTNSLRRRSAIEGNRVTALLLIPTVLMTCGLLAFQLIPDVLLGMFNPSDTFLEIGRVCLRSISWSFPMAAVCIVLGASFQALGNGIYSTLTSLARQMLVLLPVAYLLSLTGNVNNVWIAYPIAEVVSGLVTLYFFRRIYRQKIRPLFAK